MTNFRKPVTTIEKIYAIMSELRPPFANQITVAASGRVDARKLSDALERATRVNPGSTLRMRGRLGNMQWVPGRAPRLTIVKSSDWSGRDGQDAPFLARPLSATSGPSCEVQYIEGQDQSFLIFRSLHAVMDGIGTRLWAEDVMRELRGEPAIGHPCTMTDSDFATGQTDDHAALPGRDALHPCGTAQPQTSGQTSRWQRFTIENPTDGPVVALLALALAEAAREHGSGTVRLNVPADLRPFHPQQRSTGNVIGAVFPELGADVTLDSFRQDLKRRLKAHQHAAFPTGYVGMRWLPMGLLRALLKRAFAREHARGLYPFTATVSYLGSVDLAALSTPELRATTAFWIPPLADQQCFVAANSAGGRLELTVGMPAAFCSGGRFDALAERLASALSATRAAAA